MLHYTVHAFGAKIASFNSPCDAKEWGKLQSEKFRNGHFTVRDELMQADMYIFYQGEEA